MTIEKCETFYEMLDCIESVGSTTAKEEFIRYTIEHVKNAEMFFRFAFNDTVYGVSEKSFYNALEMKDVKPHPDTSFPHVSDYLNELEYIGADKQDKKIPLLIQFGDYIKTESGNSQLTALYNFFVNLPSEKKKWWCRALLHDLRMGANLKTINAVFKEMGLKTIDKFALMLASKIDIYGDISKLKLPCIMECKYDGIRIQAEVWDNTCTLTSRRGKDRTADYPEIVVALLAKFQDQHVKLDGEIVKFYGKDTESFQGVMRKDGQGKRKFVCFDLLVDENMTYKYRWSNLEMLWGSTPVEHELVLADHYHCNQIENAQKYFEVLLKCNKEGIMLKLLDSKYERGSRKHMFKCKPDYVPSMQTEHEADLLITGWKYGEGKNHEQVGTLCLEDLSGTISVDVGTGISDNTRARLTEQKDTLKGQICEIRYNEKTETGSLRFPRFIKLREDKDTPDDLSKT